MTGKVSYKNKPVASGFVMLVASDDVQYVGEITPEGTYTIPNVPSGPVKLTVTSPNPNPNPDMGRARAATRGPGAIDIGGGEAASPAPPPVAAGWFQIPERYSDLAQSGLTGTAKGSTTVIDLPLDD